MRSCWPRPRYALAQFRGRGLDVRALAPAQFPDGDVVICRLVYTEVRRYGVGWRTDYPLGERNLSIRLSELTRTRVSRGRQRRAQSLPGAPERRPAVLVPAPRGGRHRLCRSQSGRCARLREYLLKGGFLWTDDHWGTEEWEVWTRELAKVFPPGEYPIELVTPADPIFSTQVVVKQMPQIPNIGYWRGSGGDTSEQGADSAVPHFYAVRDHHGRIMLAMTHNTDIFDAFEREADDPRFFARFSPTGYALGINVLLYAMTH